MIFMAQSAGLRHAAMSLCTMVAGIAGQLACVSRVGTGALQMSPAELVPWRHASGGAALSSTRKASCSRCSPSPVALTCLGSHAVGGGDDGDGPKQRGDGWRAWRPMNYAPAVYYHQGAYHGVIGPCCCMCCCMSLIEASHPSSPCMVLLSTIPALEAFDTYTALAVSPFAGLHL